MKKIESRFRGGVFHSCWAPYAMLFPAMTCFFVFSFWPFIKNFYLALFVTDSLGNPGNYVGMANFKRVLASADFWVSVKATIKFASIVGVGTFLLSMFLAVLCINMSKGSKVYQTMYTLPMAISSAPISAIFTFILSRYGLLNDLLGTDIIWLHDERTVLFAVAFVTIWAGSGCSVLYLLVGFRNVPDELVEAATLDGAGFWTKLRSVYLPIASPQIFFVIFLNILGSFKAFGFLKQLQGRGADKSVNVLIYALYDFAFTRGRFETACVYAIFLFLMIFIVTRIQLLCEKRMVHY